MQKILFIHPNFPAQFRHIAALLGGRGYHCVFLTTNARKDWTIPGVQPLLYKPLQQQSKAGVFSSLRAAKSHAEAVVRACVIQFYGETPFQVFTFCFNRLPHPRGGD